jgi:cell division protein FtsQ
VSDRPAARRPIPTGHGRRTKPVRRASARITPVRVVAAFVAVLAVGAIYGVTVSSAFDYSRLRVDGASYTDAADVEAALADVRGENLFRVETAPLERQLEELSTVAGARVDVELPDTLAVTLDERKPILVWKIGDARYLVDAEGVLFASLGDDPPAAAADLPVVDDRRTSSTAFSVGLALDSVDLDAATRLASLVPGDVGSEATGLTVQLTDENGFVVRPTPSGWSAIFGFYTASLRTPELIPGQVRLLRSLLIGREPLVERIILASDTDGTYTTKPTPKPTETPKPTPTPKPKATPTPKPATTPKPTSSPAPTPAP